MTLASVFVIAIFIIVFIVAVIVLPVLICISSPLSYSSPPSLSFTLGTLLHLPLVSTSPFPPPPPPLPLPFSPQVYCAGMQTETPQEYITLTTGEGENFSEIFGFR